MTSAWGSLTSQLLWRWLRACNAVPSPPQLVSFNTLHSTTQVFCTEHSGEVKLQCGVAIQLLNFSQHHNRIPSSQLTPISMARSDPSKSMMLQLRIFLLYFPWYLLPPAPPTFWSALPFTFRRLKNLSILPVTPNSSLSRLLFWCMTGLPWLWLHPGSCPQTLAPGTGHVYWVGITLGWWPDSCLSGCCWLVAGGWLTTDWRWLAGESSTGSGWREVAGPVR